VDHDVQDDPAADRPLGCPDARTLLSAAADDELTGAESGRLAVHVASCPACRLHGERLAVLTRLARVRPAPGDHELADRVMAAADRTRLGRGAWLRPALAWCALVVAAQSIRPLVLADLDGAPTHVARHVGASGVALAVALLVAAWRPSRAAGLLPFAGALIVATLVATLVDTIDGSRAALAEAVHVAEAVGLLLLWLLAGSPGWERVTDLGRSIRSSRGGGARSATS
jgi:predicted anti-sigma-YlaC factor YlaD